MADLDFATLLRARGYRFTTQRQVVLDELHEIAGHATADDIYERVKARTTSINRATVYRTLRFLCDIGIVTSTSINGGHLAYELTPAEPHHHLICGVCGSDQIMDNEIVTPLLDAIATTHGFAVGPTLHLTLFGVCGHCRTTRQRRSRTIAEGVRNHSLLSCRHWLYAEYVAWECMVVLLVAVKGLL